MLGKPKRNIDLSLARSEHRREDNMSMCFKYLRFENVNSI